MRARSVRLTVRLARAALAVALLAGAATPTKPTAGVSPVADEGIVGTVLPEARLRKLHLVRPDLIPYPIAFEVYC